MIRIATMEYYLHYVEASGHDDCDCTTTCEKFCESRNHIVPLLNCALPCLDECSGSTPFAKYEERRDKMFFSRMEVQAHFGQLTVIKSLLNCKCHPCSQARRRKSLLDEDERPGFIQGSENGQILFALMAFLRKFHFVYVWFASSYREEDLGHAISQLHGTFDLLMTDDMEKGLFKEACNQAWRMLNPVHFSFSASEPRDHADSERFPFRAEKPIQGGDFGTLKRVEIVEEYYDDTVEEHMKEYEGSVINHGSERKVSKS